MSLHHNTYIHTYLHAFLYTYLHIFLRKYYNATGCPVFSEQAYQFSSSRATALFIDQHKGGIYVWLEYRRVLVCKMCRGLPLAIAKPYPRLGPRNPNYSLWPGRNMTNFNKNFSVIHISMYQEINALAFVYAPYSCMLIEEPTSICKSDTLTLDRPLALGILKK